MSDLVVDVRSGENPPFRPGQGWSVNDGFTGFSRMQHRETRRTIDVSSSPLLDITYPSVMLCLSAVAYFADVPFARFINPDQPHALDAFAVWIDQWSTRAALALLTGVGFLSLVVGRWRGLRILGAAAVLSYVAEEIVVSALKLLSKRPRPIISPELDGTLRAIVDTADLKSFPSGHSAAAFMCAIIVAAFVRSRIVAFSALAFAVAVALGRTYVAVHHLSDVMVGGAIGWFIAIGVVRLISTYEHALAGWNLPQSLRLFAAVFGILIVTYFAGQKVVPIDWASGERAADFAMASTPGANLRLAFEPFVGFGVKLSATPELDRFAWCAAAWGGAAFLGLLFFLRGRTRWIVASIVVVFGASNAFFMLQSEPRQQYPTLREAKAGNVPPLAPVAPIFVDLHFHFGDPYDAASTKLESGLRRARLLGFDAILPTYHNSWQRLRVREKSGDWREGDLFGMEWTPGPMHFLIYNRTPEPKDIASEKMADWRELIRRVHASGGVVVAAHNWRWSKDVMPSPTELADGGIDGFEVENRGPEWTSEALDRQAAISRVVRERGLLALGNNDDHGRRAFNYAWMTLDRGDGSKRIDDLIWDALTDHKKNPRILFLTTDGPRRLPVAIWPPLVFVQYFRELRVQDRVAWFFWTGALLGGVMWSRRKRTAAAK